ncbi:MAG: TonB-dependent receptor plug domain-containing protein [Bacteroidetes bacterium]|nr:TonB-dependent receptor plug domain-containing protein [Bacteroidota bacterium]MDA0903737.1 TonB-dependent receptor plug domain-containing protein [Bacteroidota bacterium]MDA1242443.1 TonB-dependent receptor plug domain-containing protein [Bacteroidota bacterium]
MIANMFSLHSKTLLCTLCAALYASTTLCAQTTPPTSSDFVLADTTFIAQAAVTGGFQTVTPENAPRALVVLNAEELGQTGASTVVEVLETVPGVDMRQRGPLGIQTDVSIRGGSFEQTALWVDGVRWSAPQTGHHLLDLPLDPEDINRVEVFRGGASHALGAGAMTGALSLRTGPGVDNGTLVVAESGTNAYMKAKVRWDFGDEWRRHRISISRTGTHGTLGRGTNTDAALVRGRYVGMFHGDWGVVRTSLGLAQKSFGAQNFYSSNFPTQYEQTLTIQGQATYEKQWNAMRIEASLHHRTHVDEFHLYREHDDYYVASDVLDSAGQTVGQVLVMDGDTAASWYQGPNNHLSQSDGMRLVWRANSRWGETFVSLDGRDESVLSNLLGVDSLGDSTPDSPYAKGDTRRNLDAAVGHRLEAGRFAMSATAAWNMNSMFGRRFVPGVDASLRLNDAGSVLFASANRSVRHPSFTDLYYTLGGAVGSRDLMPEWADHFEAGIRVSLPTTWGMAWSLEQSLFHRMGHDLIDWARPNGSWTTYAVNLREVQFSGLETVLTVGPLSRGTSDGAAEGMWQVRYGRLAWTTLEASEESLGFESNYVLDGLKSKLDMSLGLTLPGQLLVDARLSWQDRMGGYVAGSTGEEVEFYPFTQLGFTVGRAFDQLGVRAYVRIDNALDVQVMDIGNVQQPGRWIRLGVAYVMK